MIQPKEYYDEIYRTSTDYLLHYTQTKYYSLWLRILQKILNRRALHLSALDIGCGTGQLGRMLKDYDVDYYGFDFSDVAITIARLQGLRVWVGDALDYENRLINYENDCEIFIATEVLEHIEDDLKIFDLIPKGKLFIFSVPTFGHEAHVRHFKTEKEVRKRYPVDKIEQIGKRFLVEVKT